MNSPNPLKVFFLRVTDNSSKLQRLCAVVHSYFVKREKILIVVSSNEAAAYIDQLLWKMPEESFLPHVIAHSPLKERVVITTNNANINQATVLINLTATIHPNPGPAHMIYELFDLTSKEKEELSLKKQADYRNAGHEVAIT